MDDVKDGNETPGWMTTQAAKGDTDPPASKKTRRPRRTKAQMLADAEARPDAEVALLLPGKVSPFSGAVGLDMLPLAPSEIAEANREHEEWRTSRLSIVACLLSLLALALAITALSR